MLSQGSAQYVNGHTRGRAGVWQDGAYMGKMVLADGPFSQADSQQLQASIRDLLQGNVSSAFASPFAASATAAIAANFSLRISLEREVNRRYPADRVWARHLDKSERGIASSLRRQQLHLLQWSHLRSCMFLVDAEEHEGKRFGLVLKLREDSVALRPWLIPGGWAYQGLTSLRCMRWGGFMDSTFAVGRQWAWHIMEGLAADWYISHYAVENRSMYKTADGIPFNPESWLSRLARLKQVPTQIKTMCELPFVSARFVSTSNDTSTAGADGLGIVVKRHHYFNARYNGNCFGTRIKQGTTPARRSRISADHNSCEGAEALRDAMESMGVCPSQLCDTR